MKKHIAGLIAVLFGLFSNHVKAQEKSFSFPIKAIEAKPMGMFLKINDNLIFSCLVFSPTIERVAHDQDSLLKQVEIVGAASFCFRF